MSKNKTNYKGLKKEKKEINKHKRKSKNKSKRDMKKQIKYCYFVMYKNIFNNCES